MFTSAKTTLFLQKLAPRAARQTPMRAAVVLAILATGWADVRTVTDGQTVEYEQRGRPRTAHAESEVIVTAGAIGSPKIMLLSGVGPAEHLGAHGIDVVHDLPGVGENLTDHFGIDIVHELRGHIAEARK